MACKVSILSVPVSRMTSTVLDTILHTPLQLVSAPATRAALLSAPSTEEQLRLAWEVLAPHYAMTLDTAWPRTFRQVRGHVTSVSRVTSTVLTRVMSTMMSRVTCCRSATRRAPSTAWRATRCSAAPSCGRRCGCTRRRRCGPPPPRPTSPWPSPTDPRRTSMGDTLGRL